MIEFFFKKEMTQLLRNYLGTEGVLFINFFISI